METGTVDTPKRRRKPLPSAFTSWHDRNGRLTQEMLDTICNYLTEDGLPIITTCELVGISEDTYYRWFDQGKKYMAGGGDNTDDMYGRFFEETRRAVALWQMRLIRRSLSVDAYAHGWVRDLTLLERRNRQEWGRDAVRREDPSKYDDAERFL